MLSASTTKNKPRRVQLPSPLRWRRADALLALVRQRHPAIPLRLDASGWRWLRERGLTRAEAQRALGDLIEADAVTVEEASGVLVVRVAGGEGCT